MVRLGAVPSRLIAEDRPPGPVLEAELKPSQAPPEAGKVHAAGLATDHTVILLVVALVLPLLVLGLLGLRPRSGFRHWFGSSLRDFRGLFPSMGHSRHVIHDKPYLDQVLDAEFGERRPSRSRARKVGTGSGPKDSSSG